MVDESVKNRFVIRIVDDDPGVLTGLEFLLTCLGWKSARYESAEAFLEKDNRHVPGCILLDIRMPGMSGLALQQKLFEDSCALPIIIVTGHADVETAVRTLKKGAFDFLTKPVESDKLETILEDCCHRWQVKESGFGEKELIRIYKNLSDRERDILHYLTQDLTSKQIAERLGLSDRTVQGHRFNLSKRFHVHTKNELLSCLEIIRRALEGSESQQSGRISGTRLIVKFVLAKSSHNHYFRLFKQTSLQFLDLL